MKPIIDFSAVRILVLGDVMLDRYWYGPTKRISPEAPVPIVKVEREEDRPGGAANVALNIVALNAQATLLGLIGDDDNGQTLQKQLVDQRVDCHFVHHPKAPTTTKLRLISHQQQLIRADFEEGFPNFDANRLHNRFIEALPDCQAVILSDYAKGVLDDPQCYIQACKAAGKPVLIDPKGNDFNRYRGASLITPNLSELEAVVGPCANQQALVEKGLALIAEYELDALLITRSEQGMTLLQSHQPPSHLPAQAHEVYDVTGAGDTVISMLACALAHGQPLANATQLANLAAGIVVGKLGTATVLPEELHAHLHADHPTNPPLVNEQQLLQQIAASRQQGESIVMTNGCFDILHAGHVAYLQEAAQLGDRLVVAVNIDATVRALKGADRPVNPLQNRMQVLAALTCVDWVVTFEEETPERLICAVQPDFLVKGGDNDPDQIPGAQCTREAGGQVAVMQYVDGISTTQIIHAIKART